ncbi:TPA: DUF2213 domain-containing protein [Escherichia coli]|nr:DUF2213 domain-containing protein [Escherichia coli]
MTTSAKAQERSARVVDVNGYISVEGNPIIKAGVFPYVGRDIPGAPDPDKIYQVYRSEEELKKQETLDSFKLMPFINEHTWLGKEGEDPGAMPLTGMTGEKVYFDAPYIRSNIRWYSESMKQAMDDGKVELSPGFLWDVVPVPGVHNGQPFDYQQTNIRGNHLALVDEGRNGRDVRVMEAANNEAGKMTLEEIIAALGKLDAPALAAVIAAIQQMSQTTEQEATEENTETEETTTTAEEENEDETTTANEEETTQAEEEEDETQTGTASAQESKIKALTRQVQNLSRQVKAQDTGALLKELGKRNELAARLTPFVGAFACDSMDTVAVAKYGLKKLGIKDVAAGHEVSALNAALAVKAAQPSTIVAFGQDAAPTKANAVSSVIDDL